MNLADVMQALYASEIDCSVASAWNDGWEVKLEKGQIAATGVRSLAEAAQWLHEQAIAHRPESAYAQQRHGARSLAIDPEVERLRRELTQISKGCANPAFVARRALVLVPSEKPRMLSREEVDVLREDLRLALGAETPSQGTGRLGAIEKALRELVRLKALKDKGDQISMREHDEKRVAAWKAAEDALSLSE